MKLPIIRSLWIGDDLTNLEKLCIQSFLDNGHEFHLHTYGDIGGIPAGATVKPASEVLPPEYLFTYKGGSPAGAADKFRYLALAKHGGFWVDMDCVAIKPFDFDLHQTKLIFGYEGADYFGTAIIGAYPNHEPIVEMADLCHKQGVKDGAKWGSVGGPLIFTDMVRKHNLAAEAKPQATFFPFDYDHAYQIFSGGGGGVALQDLSPATYSIHFFNEGWRKFGLDKNARFDSGCLFEQLKARHGIKNLPDAPQIHADFVNQIPAHNLRQRKQRIKRERIIYLLIAVAAGFAVGLIL